MMLRDIQEASHVERRRRVDGSLGLWLGLALSIAIAIAIGVSVGVTIR